MKTAFRMDGGDGDMCATCPGLTNKEVIVPEDTCLAKMTEDTHTL